MRAEEGRRGHAGFCAYCGLSTPSQAPTSALAGRLWVLSAQAWLSAPGSKIGVYLGGVGSQQAGHAKIGAEHASVIGDNTPYTRSKGPDGLFRMGPNGLRRVLWDLVPCKGRIVAGSVSLQGQLHEA